MANNKEAFGSFHSTRCSRNLTAITRIMTPPNLSLSSCRLCANIQSGRASLSIKSSYMLTEKTYKAVAIRKLSTSSIKRTVIYGSLPELLIMTLIALNRFYNSPAESSPRQRRARKSLRYIPSIGFFQSVFPLSSLLNQIDFRLISFFNHFYPLGS